MKKNIKSNITDNKQPMEENDTNIEKEHEITSDNNGVETNSDTATVTMDTTKSHNINGTNGHNDTPTVTMENTNCDNIGIKSDNLKVPNQPAISSAIPDDKETDPTPHSMEIQLHHIAPETNTSTEVSTATTIVEQPLEKNESTKQKNMSTTNIEQTAEMSETSETTKQNNSNTTTTMNSVIEPTTVPETDASVQPDLLQGKTIPEKIAIDTLLNLCDSMEFDDPDLEDNALLMPVDRPPEIPIEPKGDIPTQPVNPEIPPEAESKSDTPSPLEGNNTDTTEIIEATKQISVTEDQSKPDDTKNPNKKRNRKNKKRNKKKKKAKTTQSDLDEVNKDVKQNTKLTKKEN